MNSSIIRQSKPRGAGKDITNLVISDMKQRANYGKKIYGQRLHAHNGRDSLIDAYQEALDLALYLRQAIEERKS